MKTLIPEGADIGTLVIRAKYDEKFFTALVKDQTWHIKYQVLFLLRKCGEPTPFLQKKSIFLPEYLKKFLSAIENI